MQRTLPLALPLTLALGACFASPAAQVGTVEEFSRLVSAGATPATGSEWEGSPELPVIDDFALADPAMVAATQQDAEKSKEPVETEAEEEDPPMNPYVQFGEQIIVREFPDGTIFITKPYSMPVGKALKVKDLLDALVPFPHGPRPPVNLETGEDAPLDPAIVRYHILEAWDEEFYSEPSFKFDEKSLPKAATKIALADLFIVTATAPMLEEFESFLNTFAAGVPMIEIEARIIEIVDADATDIGVSPITDTPIFKFGTANFVKSLDFNLPNTVDPVEALLTLGAVQDGVAFNAILQAVSTWQNVTIESRPKTVVRSGSLARLESTQLIPFFDIKSVTPNGGFNAVTSYKEVGVKLWIVPRVIGSTKLALEVYLEGSQVVGQQLTVSQATEEGSAIFVPVIANRTARTVVYLEPGQVLVIGGLTVESKQEVVNKVPLLGDIPLLGFLFRSTFEEFRKEHVIFAISPRIIQPSEFQQEF